MMGKTRHKYKISIRAPLRKAHLEDRGDDRIKFRWISIEIGYENERRMEVPQRSCPMTILVVAVLISNARIYGLMSRPMHLTECLTL
jgi:hypothetical protein